MAGQRALLTHSDDEGRSWSIPADPFVPPAIDGRPGLFRCCAVTSLGRRRVLAALAWVDHSDPSLPFFNETTEGLLDTKIFLAWSEDDGDTWSTPQPMDTAPFACPVPITGSPIVLANGDLACQFELNKHYDEESPWHHRSVLMFSRDGGHSWPEYVLTSDDPENRIFYWDQRPAVLPGGRVLDLFWTFDRTRPVYLNIHARESNDHGRTWSDYWDIGIPGQPAPAVPLADGTIGMAYVDRTTVPQIKMRASSDAGRTWPAQSEIVLEQAGGTRAKPRKPKRARRLGGDVEVRLGTARDRPRGKRRCDRRLLLGHGDRSHRHQVRSGASMRKMKFPYGTAFWQPPNPPRDQHRFHLENTKRELGFDLFRLHMPWNWHTLWIGTIVRQNTPLQLEF